MRDIRLSKIEDIDTIMQVIDSGRNIMRLSGNLNQWTNGYPTKEQLLKDISSKNNYSVFDNNKLSAVFTFIKGPDITYKNIYNGSWLNDETNYYVVHRMAKLQKAKNIFNDCLDYCFKKSKNIRLDTHRDNKIMQKVIENYNFTYCGIIYLADGSERLAYQKILTNY